MCHGIVSLLQFISGLFLGLLVGNWVNNLLANHKLAGRVPSGAQTPPPRVLSHSDNNDES